ncbi:MAG: hypothetical protein V4436_00965 [Patescibacteria group bacterium]
MGTSSIFAPNYASEMIVWVFGQIEAAKAHGFRVAWDYGWDFFLQNWLLVSSVLLVILVLSALTAFLTGRWGWFGSVLYHYFYGAVMIGIGFTFGPEMFANDYFEIAAVLIYGMCFWLVGQVLKGTGLR